MLSPDRKTVRYLYGISFLPFDFQMGVYEAAQGKVSPTTARLLRFCFSYDPQGKRYVFSMTKVVGGTILLLAGGLVIFLVSQNRLRRRDLEGKE